MRAFVVLGCLLFGGQLVVGFFLDRDAPGAAPHLGLGIGFVTLGLLQLARLRVVEWITVAYLALTIGGRIHFLVKQGDGSLPVLAPAAAFVAWALASGLWLALHHPDHGDQHNGHQAGDRTQPGGPAAPPHQQIRRDQDQPETGQ